MPVRRARPLQSIYTDVAGYDLVIAPDNPLADALNRRVESPRFGIFATTPRRLASQRRETAEDRLAFLNVIDQTDHSWKAVSYAIGNVLQCWEHQGHIDAIFEYDSYVDETTEAVVEIMRDLETTSTALSEYTIDPDRAVAVVGIDQLTELERSILPADVDHIELFTDSAFDLPQFNIFASPADIVDALLDTIDTETADDVAVVLDSASQYSSLVESAFEAEGIPYYGGPGFSDDPDHRAFIRLLRLVYRGSGTTVGDIRPLCSSVGIDVDIDHEQKRLDTGEIPELDWITEFCNSAGEFTFAEALERYESRIDRSLTAFYEELDALGIAAKPLTEQRVDDLSFYLQAYEVPVERENEGVLLADAKSSGYVDRPAVFYLGLDESWTHTAPQRPWVNADAQYDRYSRQFQLLLQSGTEQYYLVQETQGGQPVTPCLYLGELLDEEFERFSDLDSMKHTRPTSGRAGGFETENQDVEPNILDTISQSSLNNYVNSPRDYFFSQLLDSPDRDYFREGNLFHDFAEFYVNHPEVISSGERTRQGETGGTEGSLDEIVDLMIEEADPFFHDDAEPLRRRRYRIGLETIVEYLDKNPPADHEFQTGSSGWGTNVVAAYFDKPVDSPLTERWFEDADLGVKGKIDLVRAPDQIVDHKSGSKKSAYSVVSGAATDPPNDTPNFQAPLYLSYIRTQQPETRIEFTFFHFLETLEDVIAEDATPTLEETTTTVPYHPTTFDEFVSSREAYETLLDGYNDCVATFEALGFDRYQEILSTLSFPDTADREELRESAFAEEFTAAVTDATADVDASKGCDQAIRALNGVRQRAFFEEDLDEFGQFLSDQIETINQHKIDGTRFPIDGPGGEPNYRRVDHRDLLLEGER